MQGEGMRRSGTTPIDDNTADKRLDKSEPFHTLRHDTNS